MFSFFSPPSSYLSCACFRTRIIIESLVFLAQAQHHVSTFLFPKLGQLLCRQDPKNMTLTNFFHMVFMKCKAWHLVRAQEVFVKWLVSTWYFRKQNVAVQVLSINDVIWLESKALNSSPDIFSRSLGENIWCPGKNPGRKIKGEASLFFQEYV